MSSRPQNNRYASSDNLAKLKHVLRDRERDLQEAIENNKAARTRLALLKALVLATSAVHEVKSSSAAIAAARRCRAADEGSGVGKACGVTLGILGERVQALGAVIRTGDFGATGREVAAASTPEAATSPSDSTGSGGSSAGAWALQAHGDNMAWPGALAPEAQQHMAMIKSAQQELHRHRAQPLTQLDMAAAATAAEAGDKAATGPEQRMGPADQAPQALSASLLLKRVTVACASYDMQPADFLAYWRDGVRNLALLVHQHQCSQTEDHLLVQMVQEMSARSMAACLSRSWYFCLMGRNLVTGGRPLPPDLAHGVADRVISGMNLTQQQELALVQLRHWWVDQVEGSGWEEESEALLLAAAAPSDLDVQEAVLRRLEGRLGAYRVFLAAALIIMAVVLSPAQVAEMFVQSWPCFPDAPAIVNRLYLVRRQKDLERRQQEQQEQQQ